MTFDRSFDTFSREAVRNALEEPEGDRERALEILLLNRNTVDMEVHPSALD